MTNLEWCFLNSNDELRSGWKFAAYVVLFLIFWVAAVFVVGGVSSIAGPQLLNLALNAVTAGPLTMDVLVRAKLLVQLTLNAAALVIPAAGATLFLARIVDRAPASKFVGFSGWAGQFAKGAVIGAALLTILIAGFAVCGHIVVGAGSGRLGAAVLMLTVLAVSAANEELAFRGYAMQSLAPGIGRGPAAAVTAILFGLLHMGNPHASIVGIMNTMLAGLMLAAAYYKARSLWLPFGIHVAWNVGLGMVLGFPMSGLNLDSLWRTSVEGAVLLTGGEYGPEGGLVGTAAFAAGFAAIRLLRLRESADRTINT